MYQELRRRASGKKPVESLIILLLTRRYDYKIMGESGRLKNA
jgi:hypothetical protein